MHVQAVILPGHLVHLPVIPQIDHAYPIFFLQLQKPVHHLAVQSAVVSRARVEHHGTVPGLPGIHNDVLHGARDGTDVESLRILSLAYPAKRQPSGTVVCGELTDKGVKIFLLVNPGFHAADIGILPHIGERGPAYSLLYIAETVALRHVFHKGNSHGAGSLRNRGAQKAKVLPPQRTVLDFPCVFQAVPRRISRMLR